MSVKVGDKVYFVRHRLNEIQEWIVTEYQADNINGKLVDFGVYGIDDVRLFYSYESAEKFLSELNKSLILHHEYDIKRLQREIDILKNVNPKLIRGDV